MALEECMLGVHALAQCYDPLDRDDNERVRVNPHKLARSEG
jgi:hypothetical protein